MKELKYFEIFDGVEITVELVKKLWRKVAVANHPDKGGSEDSFKMAQMEYDYLLGMAGATFTATQDSPDAYSSFDEFLSHITPVVRECFEAVYSIPGIREVEVCGQWIWVGLDKSQVSERTALKAICVSGKKFRFSGKKARWFWAGVASRSRGKYTMDDIRGIYGSDKFKKQDLEQIEG